MNYSIIATIRPTPIATVIRNCQAAIVDFFGGGAAMQLPLHVTLARISIDLTPQQELEIQEKLSAKAPTLSIVINKCEMLKQAGIVWLKVMDFQAVIDMAQQTTGLMQRIVPLKRDTISYATAPHLTLAYRNYSERDIATIFEFSTSIFGPILPLEAEIDGVLLCRQNFDGIWNMAVPHP